MGVNPSSGGSFVTELGPEFKSSDSQSSALVTPYLQRVTFLFLFFELLYLFPLFFSCHAPLFNLTLTLIDKYGIGFCLVSRCLFPLHLNHYKSSLLAEISRSLSVVAEVLVNLECKWKVV